MSDGDKSITSNGNVEYFDIPAVHLQLKNCLLDNGDIHLDSYLKVYKELVKFCNLLGNVFKFVKDEIESKSEILHQLKSQHAEEFQTLKGMVKYEMESGKLNKKNYTSGCRTLLRLHWGLDFIRTFLKRVHAMDLEDKTSTVGREVYHTTLGSRHAWYIRYGASAAMYLLPSKRILIDMICGGQLDSAIVDEMPHMLQTADEVYNRTEIVYEMNNLLKLE
uniref:Glycolipid transfer protein domain-containing protein 1 n=1 Tax=Lygus hesperus TaxID=30085 RepID=A0A146KJJ9_LYGHE